MHRRNVTATGMERGEVPSPVVSVASRSAVAHFPIEDFQILGTRVDLLSTEVFHLRFLEVLAVANLEASAIRDFAITIGGGIRPSSVMVK